ncbi:MAG: hydrolase/carboxylic esterase [Hyphomicrobiales bacterium]|nr:hydrolase/carboxylic esterase [Hyphomicrobiales bacterium]
MRATGSGFLAGAMTLAWMTVASAAEPIQLRDMGSFHVGGRIVELTGQPVRDIVRVPGGPTSKLDPNGRYQVEHMYAQYFLVQNKKARYPILMWHGGGLTGATYETTPDGREGWRDMFIRKGWDVYVTDAVERGRSGFASPDIWNAPPLFLTQTDPWERFRIGPGPGSFDADPAKRKLLPGNQFPVEAFDAFTKQIVPRWLSTDDAVLQAYLALIDKVCPCVILAHSQGGFFGFRAAEARPDKVKALVAVEPASAGPAKGAASLKNVPVLTVFGDYIEQDPRWVAYSKNVLAYLAALKAAGGSGDVIDLPKLGIKGNSHMLMMDRNNRDVADQIQKWLVGRGLVEP